MLREQVQSRVGTERDLPGRAANAQRGHRSGYAEIGRPVLLGHVHVDGTVLQSDLRPDLLARLKELGNADLGGVLDDDLGAVLEFEHHARPQACADDGVAVQLVSVGEVLPLFLSGMELLRTSR